MGIAGLPLFAALTEKMRWHQARQGLLAENVANAETPGFRGRDLKAFNFEEHVAMSTASVATAIATKLLPLTTVAAVTAIITVAPAFPTTALPNLAFVLVTRFGVAAQLLVTFVIDTVVIAGLFRVLSGLRPSARSLWSGAILGGIGLTVLQVLSGLFVGGASTNPLLASFGSLIALLIWLNLSSQVVLIASSYIVTGVDDETDRVAAKYGATSAALRRLKRAERRANDAAAEKFFSEGAASVGRAIMDHSGWFVLLALLPILGRRRSQSANEPR